MEGRYYHNLQKRILKGKTGNGLSANYVALGGSFENNQIYYTDDQAFRFPNANALGFQLVTGIQRTYSKHFYFDFNMGIQFRRFGFNDTYSRFNLLLTALFAVGYRF